MMDIYLLFRTLNKKNILFNPIMEIYLLFRMLNKKNILFNVQKEGLPSYFDKIT